MYIQTVVLKKKTSREEDKVCSYLLLEESSHGAWQHLAAAPPQAHLSCTRDKKLARPATGRLGWLLGTKACTWPSCTDKKNLPVFLTFQLLAFFGLHPVLQTLNLLLLVSELLAGFLVQLEEVTQTTHRTKFLIYNVKGKVPYLEI
jgi:hypothetical protein